MPTINIYIYTYIYVCTYYIIVTYMTTTKMNGVDFLPLKKLKFCKRCQFCKVLGELNLAGIVSYTILKPYRIEKWDYPKCKPIIWGGINVGQSITVSLKQRLRRLHRGSTLWPEEVGGSKAHSDNDVAEQSCRNVKTLDICREEWVVKND